MLQELIYRIPGGTVDAAAFNSRLDANADLSQIRSAFLGIFEPRNQAQDAMILENVYARLTDPNFVKSVEYAVALDEETPKSIIKGLLEKLVLDKSFIYDHGNFLRIIWARLSDGERKQFAVTLGQEIEGQVPTGRWFPLVRMLQTLGSGAWVLLPRVTQIRLESMITKDVLAGYKDVFNVTAKGGGALGTYAVNLWPNFSNLRQLALNLISMLHQSWYTQNYVATHFKFSELVKIAEKTGTRGEFIQALASAIRNDAKVVKAKLADLPDDWRAELL